MTTEDFKRKLTAILSADVEGYSRLMGEDEDSTVRTLTAYRNLMSSLIERYHGHVVDSPGDNLLAEFGSVRDTVRCAVEIQEELRIRNTELPEDRKMQFRIGINLGDVIEEGGRIYGDGINVAARVEGLAEGGGICISGTVYDSIRNKLSMSYDFLGEHNVKNIREPVRVYRIRMEPEAATLKTPVISDMKEGPKIIAVLPFVNLSSDPEQEYFVDGLSEEILNSLAHIPDLTVIARTSSFSFKGKDKTIQEIASVLGVDRILEGSVRKAGNALRITAQLVKAVDGSHLWSKTYDRELKVKEIFAVQEDIATSVADELKVTLGIGKSLKQLGGTDNLDAYELYLVARGQRYNLEFSRALESIDAAIALDPEFALAWAEKVIVHSYLALYSSPDQVSLEYDTALSAALKAIELEPTLGQAYFRLGSVYSSRGEFIKAELAYRKGMELTTESIDYTNYGLTVHYSTVGYLRKCNELFEEFRRNDPLDPEIRAGYMFSLGLHGDMERAEEEYERGKSMFGDQWILGDLFITALRLGAKDVLSINEIPELPGASPTWAMAREHIESPEEGLEELRQIYNNANNLNSSEFIFMALFAAYFGDQEFALNVMERSVSLQAVSLVGYWAPIFHEGRQLPRFKEFVREIGLVDYWNEFGWPDLCRPVGDGDFECD